MTRKRRKKDIFDILSDLFGPGIVLTFFGTFYFTNSFYWATASAILFLGIIFGVRNYFLILHEERLRKSGIEEIDKMDGREFERYLATLFKGLKYKVDLTRASRDFGADLVISQNGRRIVIQAKRQSKNVGLQAVQQVQTSIAYYRANEGWVVTNRDYTSSAYELARSNRVKLINRDKLIDLILQLK